MSGRAKIGSVQTKTTPYQREVSPLPRSLAAIRFRMDSKTVNQHYWVASLSEGGLSSQVKKSIREGFDDENPIELFSFPKRYENRIPNNLAELEESIKVHKRWYHLTTLVMLSAALERYLNDISRTAIRSDPTTSPGFPKKLDGLFLEKYKIRYPAVDSSRLIVGDWNSRVAAYKSIFQSAPSALVENIGELEAIRQLRNKIAHSMGFDDKFDHESQKSAPLDLVSIALSKASPTALEVVSLSSERLIKFMATTQRVVDAIDNDLLERFVGSYEVASLYMSWRSDSKIFEEKFGFETPNNHKKAQYAQSRGMYAKTVFAHTLRLYLNVGYYRQMENYIVSL